MIDSGKMPVLELTSQMRGRTARVWVFRDRIEWYRRTGPSLLSRSVLAAATDGGSEVGVANGDGEAESVQLDAISSIATERVGMHVRLSFATKGSSVEMAVSRSKATRMLEVLRELMSSEPSAGH